jgi:tellurite resistance protein
MEIKLPPPELVPYGLRAMKMIALANGRFDDTERSLLATGQRFFGTHVDVDSLAPIEPEELARHIVDPALRHQLVRGMIILSLVDGEATPDEVALVERFAGALGVAGADLKLLHRLADGHLLLARFDIARRFFARQKVVELTREKGIGWLARSMAALAGLREDHEIAGRFRALEHAPAGSLGRAYFDFIIANQFSFPGEKGSPPEAVMYHDMTHVLSGYGTDPGGELQVLAFHAGCRKEDQDPFSFIWFGLAQFHLGIQVGAVPPGKESALDPPRMLAALQRGTHCTIDPTRGWDPWPVMTTQLEELRARYSIPPL